MTSSTADIDRAAGRRVRPGVGNTVGCALCRGRREQVASRIAELLPDHRHYVEPYAGGLAVLLAKRRAPMETVNDIDDEFAQGEERSARTEVLWSNRSLTGQPGL